MHIDRPASWSCWPMKRRSPGPGKRAEMKRSCGCETRVLTPARGDRTRTGPGGHGPGHLPAPFTRTATRSEIRWTFPWNWHAGWWRTGRWSCDFQKKSPGYAASETGSQAYVQARESSSSMRPWFAWVRGARRCSNPWVLIHTSVRCVVTALPCRRVSTRPRSVSPVSSTAWFSAAWAR